MGRTLNDAAVARAAAIMAEAQRSGSLVDRLPEDCRPTTADDGKAIQAAVVERLGLPVVGWKIGYAAPAERRQMEHVPVPGRLLEGAIVDSPAVVKRADFHHPLIEAEIMLRLSADLPARGRSYRFEEVAGALASAHVGIEVADPRYADFNGPGNPEFMADNACARMVVVGPEIAGWRDAPLAAIDVEMRFDGEVVSRGRTGDDRCDGVWSLWWLVNDIGLFDYGMTAGQIISSGAVAKVLPLGEAREVVVRFNEAEARLTLTD